MIPRRYPSVYYKKLLCELLFRRGIIMPDAIIMFNGYSFNREYAILCHFLNKCINNNTLICIVRMYLFGDKEYLSLPYTPGDVYVYKSIEQEYIDRHRWWNNTDVVYRSIGTFRVLNNIKKFTDIKKKCKVDGLCFEILPFHINDMDYEIVNNSDFDVITDYN